MFVKCFVPFFQRKTNYILQSSATQVGCKHDDDGGPIEYNPNRL